jgi:hypothetical protein
MEHPAAESVSDDDDRQGSGLERHAASESPAGGE